MVEERINEFIEVLLKSRENFPRDVSEYKEFISIKLFEILQVSNSEENYEFILNEAWEILKQKNLEALNEHIENICEYNIKDMCSYIENTHSLEEVLKIINFYNEKVTVSLSEIVFQQSELYDDPVTCIDKFMRNFRSKIIEKSGLKGFSLLSDIENTIIKDLSVQIELKIMNFASITMKERSDNFWEILTIGKKKLSDSFLEIFPYFPIFLLESFLEVLNEKILKIWETQQQNFSNNLKIFFESEIESLIEKIRQGQIKLFDPSAFSPEIRYVILVIIKQTFPYSEHTTFTQFWYFKQFLGVELDETADNWSLEEWSKYFYYLLSQNLLIKHFLILSLVVMMSMIDFWSSENSTRYEAINREWLKRIIYSMFYQKTQESSAELAFIEWNLVLATECALAKKFSPPMLTIRKVHKNFHSKKSGFMNIFSKIQILQKKSNPDELYRFKLKNLSTVQSINCVVAIPGLLSDGEKEGWWDHLTEYNKNIQTFVLKWDASSWLQSLTFDIPKGSFNVNIKKAKATGKILAETIMSSQDLGKKTVSLVGFSLGARVIFYCLEELVSSNYKVHNVFLLGGAAPKTPEKWNLCKNAVAGRLVNAYSFKDKVLSYAYFLATRHKAIGSGPIEVSGIENINVTNYAGGHLQYKENFKKLLKAIRY